jgi:hypothetical protein
MNVWDFAAQQPVAACIIAAFALAGLCVLAVYFAVLSLGHIVSIFLFWGWA